MIHLFQFFGEPTGVNLREERSECQPETRPGPFCTPREDYTSEVSAAFVEVAWVLSGVVYKRLLLRACGHFQLE